MVKICEVVDNCEECPRYGDDCDGDKMAEHTDLISRADAIEAIQNAYCKPCKERGDDHNEVRCRVCEYDNAIIQIDALPSADAKWIPCSERLPREDGCYLVSTTGTNNDIIDIAYYTEEIWHKASRIKAWMPLPKPWKGADDE